MTSLTTPYSRFQQYFAQMHIEFADYAGIIVHIATNQASRRTVHVPAVIKTVWTSAQASTEQTAHEYQNDAPKGTQASLRWQ